MISSMNAESFGSALSAEAEWESRLYLGKFLASAIARLVGTESVKRRFSEACAKNPMLQAKVRKRGQGRGLHNVWDPIQNDARNRALIIHDSGGFEAGENGTLETVMAFIKDRSEQGRLSEQLHCIW